MDWNDVHGDGIQRFAWDDRTKELVIEWKRGKYRYAAPIEVYWLLMEAPGKTAYFNTKIKPFYLDRPY